MVSSGLSGTRWDSVSGLDGTLRECGGLRRTEDLCLLIRLSWVRDPDGSPFFEAKKPLLFIKEVGAFSF